MIQIKTFYKVNEANEWLELESENIDVKDIKYCTILAEDEIKFRIMESILIIYEKYNKNFVKDEDYKFNSSKYIEIMDKDLINPKPCYKW